MEILANATLGLSALVLTACSTISWEKSLKQDVAWGNLHMKLPATWVVTVKEDRLEAESKATGESVLITEMVPAPHFLAKNPSPLQIIEKNVEVLSPPDPQDPEFYTIEPYRIFYMPCGEPAAVEVEGLGGNEFEIAYSIASNGLMYAVNFYRIGTPGRKLRFYQKIIESAYVRGYAESKCLGEPMEAL